MGKSGVSVHDFKESLAFSHSFEDHPIWSVVYKKAFPEMIDFISYKQDGFWQREGIDRGVILSNTKQIFIDEKVRGRNKKTGKVYEDIALEYLSDEGRNKPGWICKPLRADYIAYLIAPLGICHLLPVIQLQSAWVHNGDSWKSQVKYHIRSENKGYTTVSVPVEPKILYKAIGQQLRVNFKPFEIDK